MDGKRIFVAFDISEAVRIACDRHIRYLREMFPKVRVGWERSEKLHITLKFLGDTDPIILNELQSRVAKIGSQYVSFRLRLSAAGIFPTTTRPRILWIGVDDPSNTVIGIQSQIEDICADLRFKKENKPFRPHITIGRAREFQAAAELANEHLQTKIEPVEFDVSEIVIYESKLLPTGSAYSVVERAKLRSGESATG